MPLKIFHTADLHLGLTHGKHPKEIAGKLAQGRFETLASMIATASERRADLFVMGGDLFDTTRVTKETITRAAELFSSFEGQVLILPGNHDYVTGDEDPLWNTFKKHAKAQVRVLDTPEVVTLDALSVALYPAPCRKRHSPEPATGWIQGAQKPDTARFHIGLAHGSFEGLSPDLAGDHFPMKKDPLLATGLDLWLMGHIHLQFPKTPGSFDRIFYPGTPEPDGFDCRHEGTAWFLTLQDDKSIHAERISTGRYRFIRETLEIESLTALREQIKKYSDPAYQRVLMDLEVTGVLPRDQYQQVGSELGSLRDAFLSLRTGLTSLEIRLTPEEIRKEFPEGSFALRLLSHLAEDEADHEALQLAYQTIQALKSGEAKS
jgi:DNA repair exonuclease SbcCD nuclease subunit